MYLFIRVTICTTINYNYYMYRNYTQSKVVTLFFHTTLTLVQMSMKYLKTPSVHDFHSALHICSFIIYHKIYNKAAHTCHRSQSEQFSSLKTETCNNPDSTEQEQHPPLLPIIASCLERSNISQNHRHTEHGLWNLQSRLRGNEFTGVIRNSTGLC